MWSAILTLAITLVPILAKWLQGDEKAFQYEQRLKNAQKRAKIKARVDRLSDPELDRLSKKFTRK